MGKKQYNSFEEELQDDYHKHKKVAKIKAWLKLIEVGLILIICIGLIIMCTTKCSNSINMLNTLG